jgi:hypothetical protein
MAGLFSTPIPPHKDLVRLEAREVVMDLFQVPHLLTRVTLTGPHFAHRAQEPYVAIGKIRSKFVRISEDGLRVDAYFDRPLPSEGQVVFGWYQSVDLIVPEPFRFSAVQTLDRERLRSTLPRVIVPDTRPLTGR